MELKENSTTIFCTFLRSSHGRLWTTFFPMFQSTSFSKKTLKNLPPFIYLPILLLKKVHKIVLLKFLWVLKSFHDLIFSESLSYHTRAIITRGLHILNPLFEGQKRFFNEVFSENSAFMYGQYSTQLKSGLRWRAIIQYLLFYNFNLWLNKNNVLRIQAVDLRLSLVSMFS